MNYSIQESNCYYNSTLPLAPLKPHPRENAKNLISQMTGLLVATFGQLKTQTSPYLPHVITALSKGCNRIFTICRRQKIVASENAIYEEACSEQADGCLRTYLSIHRDFGLLRLDDWNVLLGIKSDRFKIHDWNRLGEYLKNLGLATLEDLQKNLINNRTDLSRYLADKRFDLMLETLANEKLFKIKNSKDWESVGIAASSKEELRERLATYKITDMEMLHYGLIYSKTKLKDYIDERFDLLWDSLTQIRTGRQNMAINFTTRLSYPLFGLFLDEEFKAYSLDEWRQMGIEAKSLESVKLRLLQLGLRSLAICDKKGINTGLDLKNYIHANSSAFAPPRKKLLQMPAGSPLNLMLQKKIESKKL